jgi:hypothetical protein
MMRNLKVMEFNEYCLKLFSSYKEFQVSDPENLRTRVFCCFS